MAQGPQPTSKSAEDPSKAKLTVSIFYCLAMIAGLALTWFLYSKIPQSNVLIVVPELLLLVSLVIPILLWQHFAPQATASRVAAIASCFIWILGILASLKIRPSSNLIYMADGLLLVGFIPLLYLWRFSWTWILFGLFNYAIGVFLQAIAFMPDSLFPEQLVIAKHHLAHYHPSITWWVFGGMALTFGLVRLIRNAVKKMRLQK